MKKVLALFSLALIMFSCDVAKSVSGAYNLTQCKYNYNSISGLTLGGVNVQNLSSLTSLNPISLAGLLSSFSSTSGSLPLQFTLNLDVQNPGTQQALLEGLIYALDIDGVEMTTGSIASQLQIAPGGTSKLPVNLSFDLKKAMSGQSADAIKNMALNFAGLGNEATKVTMRLRPTITVAGSKITSPIDIPVSFTYGKGSK